MDKITDSVHMESVMTNSLNDDSLKKEQLRVRRSEALKMAHMRKPKWRDSKFTKFLKWVGLK